MSFWGWRNWKIILLLAVTAAASVLVAFELVGVFRQSTTVVGTAWLDVVEWRSEAITCMCIIGDSVENTYDNGEISAFHNLTIYDFRGSAHTFALALDVKAHVSSGYVHKLNLTVEEDYYYSMIADSDLGLPFARENVTITECTDFVRGCGVKASLVAVNVNRSSGVSLYYPFAWVLGSSKTKNQTRLLTINSRIIYFNGTVYKQVVQPLQIRWLPDENDSFETADEITAGEYGDDPKLVISGIDTQDYYKIYLKEEEIIQVVMNPSRGRDFDLHLYDPDGNERKNSTNRSDVQDSITFKTDSTGYWFIEVRFQGGEGFYIMSVCILDSAFTP